MDLKKFKVKELINENSTQKRVYLLGTLQGQQQKGEAIVILTPKIFDLTNQKIDFNNIQTKFINDIYGRFDASLINVFEVQSIYPITQKHKNKYARKAVRMIKQTGQMYQKGKEKLLEKQLKHIDWVQNIIDGKAQVQRVLHKDPQGRFIHLPDFKFTDLKDLGSLHLTTIFVDKNLNSIRDLKTEHLQMLQDVLESIKILLKQKLGFQYEQSKVYFHYPPTFYRLHLHITNVMNHSVGACVERGHELETVIDNIKIKGNYYQQAKLNTFVQIQKE